MSFSVFILGLLFGEPTLAKIGQWQETCPAGYSLVPKNTDYVSYNFCVMTHEARALTSAGTVDLDGCNEAGCTTNNWGTASHSPSSQATGLPWRRLDRNTARNECRSLGHRYDLIGNAEWQTIARNIEVQRTNWTTGTVGVGCIFRGNSGETTCGYDGANPEGGTGRNVRARHFLSNGQQVWDFAGNLTEYLRDDSTLNYGSDTSIVNINDGTYTVSGMLDDGVARFARAQFGPLGTYGTCSSTCGYGFGFVNGASGGVSRGGNFNDGTSTGIYMTYLPTGTTGVGSPPNGLRCVYYPNDPCAYPGIVAAGAKCQSGQLFVGTLRGYDYYTTPSGCTNSATPTCAGGIDTTFKEWMGTTGSNVDIAAVPNIADAATPSAWASSGEVLSPIIAADASVSSDSYADFCENMNYAGKQDWFQPNKTEHGFMFCKSTGANYNPIYPEEAPGCYTFGGKVNALTGFGTTDGYPSAEEVTANSHRDQDFFSGRQNTDQKTNGGFARCMRREVSKDPCAGTPALGTACRGGAIYAGQFDGGKYMITPSGCNDSATPVCSGSVDTLTKIWRGSSGTNVDIAGIANITADSAPSLSTQRGHVVTPLITGAASVSADSAADYCESLVYGGYSDWFLPSKSELGYLYCHSDARATHNTNYPDENSNCSYTGGMTSLLTGFANEDYQSASEASSTNSYRQYFSDGGQYSGAKSSSIRLRCIRRYDEVPDPAIVQAANHAGIGSQVTSRALTVASTGSGNLIAVAILTPGTSAVSVSSVTDNASNSYSSAGARCVMDSGGGGSAEIWYATNSTAGATSITINTASSTYIQAYAVEVSNIDTTSPLDGASALSNQTSSATPVAPKITSSGLYNFVYSVIQSGGTVTGTNSPFLAQPVVFGNVASYLLAPSTGTLGAGWTQGSAVYCASTASFKARP